MDTLAKQKLIDTRDFLVELLIVGCNLAPVLITTAIKLERARGAGLVAYDYAYDKVELTKKGHAFINEHKDLV